MEKGEPEYFGSPFYVPAIGNWDSGIPSVGNTGAEAAVMFFAVLCIARWPCKLDIDYHFGTEIARTFLEAT